MRFGDLLRDELACRRQRNPRYSLRSFARFLGVDHSTLSQLVRARRRPTRQMIAQLGGRLRLSPALLDECAAVENDRLVLSALSRQSFRPDVRWIAVRTGLSIDDINISLHRLLHSGALAMVSRGSWAAER